MKLIMILSTMFLGFPYLVMGSSNDDGNALIESVEQACKNSNFALLNSIVTKFRLDYNVYNPLIARFDKNNAHDWQRQLDNVIKQEQGSTNCSQFHAAFTVHGAKDIEVRRHDALERIAKIDSKDCKARVEKIIHQVCDQEKEKRLLVKKVIDAIENAIDLKSLSPFNQDIWFLKFTIKRILDECRRQKEKEWKPLAMKLCLAKDRPEYKAIISKYNDLPKINKILIECTKLEKCGWLGASQILHDEKLRQYSLLQFSSLKMEKYPHIWAIDKEFIAKQVECKTEDVIAAALKETAETLELFSDEYKLILQKGKEFAEKQAPDLKSK